MWWYTSAIPTLRRQIQEKREYEAHLGWWIVPCINYRQTKGKMVGDEGEREKKKDDGVLCRSEKKKKDFKDAFS